MHRKCASTLCYFTVTLAGSVVLGYFTSSLILCSVMVYRCSSLGKKRFLHEIAHNNICGLS